MAELVNRGRISRNDAIVNVFFLSSCASPVSAQTPDSKVLQVEPSDRIIQRKPLGYMGGGVTRPSPSPRKATGQGGVACAWQKSVSLRRQTDIQAALFSGVLRLCLPR